MPLVFVHGVNNRLGPTYEQDRRLREQLMQELLLEPLGPPYSGMSIHDAYWGDLGARFAWGLRSLPEVRFHENASPPYEMITEAERALAELALPARSSGEESLATPQPTSLRSLATRDLPTLMEALLGEIAYGEASIEGGFDGVGARSAPVLPDAELLVAADEAAHDPGLSAALARVTTDAEVADLLADVVRQRLEARLVAAEGPETPPIEVAGGYESAASSSRLLGRQAEERIRRMANRLPRALGMSVLHARRAQSHERASRFLGDVFTYLRGRGTASAPGPIIERVLDQIQQARTLEPDEPLLLFTHSMGGNIVYDILTHFAPELDVALWCSVGGQIAQFEEMKLFHASDPALRHPDRVASLAPRVARWLNIYDPADIFSFKAEPVFEGVIDLRYSTGSGIAAAHGAYFRRPSFYRLLREHLG